MQIEGGVKQPCRNTGKGWEMRSHRRENAKHRLKHMKILSATPDFKRMQTLEHPFLYPSAQATPILSLWTSRGHFPRTLCVTSTTWISRIGPRDTYWGTSPSSASVKWKYCFAVYQLENNRKQKLNAHLTLKVFKNLWKKQNLSNYSKKQRQHFWVEPRWFCVHLKLAVPCIHLQV